MGSHNTDSHARNGGDVQANGNGNIMGEYDSGDDTLRYPNPDELYDPEIDDRDEKWLLESLNIDTSQTDAVLSCPACFSTLSMLCQRHESFSHQFRAIFVQNVTIDLAKTVIPIGNIELDHGEHYSQVLCKICNTEVGVVDQENVYHFYHVLPSLGGV